MPTIVAKNLEGIEVQLTLKSKKYWLKITYSIKKSFFIPVSFCVGPSLIFGKHIDFWLTICGLDIFIIFKIFNSLFSYRMFPCQSPENTRMSPSNEPGYFV